MAHSLPRIVIVLPTILAGGPAIAEMAKEAVSWCTDAMEPRPKLSETYLVAAFDLLRSKEPHFDGGGRAYRKGADRRGHTDAR